MNISRKLPIGVQSFKVLRESHYLYADKTDYLFRLVQSGRVYFLSRPRRFGKSLFLSTLAAYFLGQKELFKGLYLEKAEEELAVQENRVAWQEYQVLYIDFNTENYSDEQSMHSILHTHLQRWEQLYGANTAEQTFPSRFKGIVERAYNKTGKQVVILVDEYDKPLLQTMGVNESLNEDYRNTLKAFYSVIKTCDQYIRFAFLTGVTKFSKISIFSDLNNLNDISLLPKHAGICGISQRELEATFAPEIEALAQANELTYDETLKQLKQNYDGYCFAQGAENMYNPFSLLRVFDGQIFQSYWFATGTPTFLVKFLKEAHYFIPDLDGNVVLNEDGLQTYRAVAQDPFPILFQSGYLTIKKYDAKYRLYSLGYPNDEVRYGFLNNLLPAYTNIREQDTGVSIVQFTKDIEAGEVDSFMKRMQAIISGIPYDNFGEENLKLREHNYQTAVYLIFALMGQFVQTEVHCSAGRADCVVITADTVYIFEFKLNGNSTAEDAIAQIHKQNYAGQYHARGKKIIAIGAGFDKHTRTIKDWAIDNGKCDFESGNWVVTFFILSPLQTQENVTIFFL